MTVRPLAVDEFIRLKDVADGFVPNPMASIAIVAEQDGKIIGRMLAVEMAHVEGTWVAEEKRSGMIGYRMEQAMLHEMRARGVRMALAYTADEKHGEYMERLGWKKEPYTVWSKRLEV